MKNYLKVLILMLLISCQDKDKNSPNSDFAITITSASISSGSLILTGNDLHNVNTVSPISGNLSGYSMNILSKTSNSLVIKLSHASNSALALAMGTVLSFAVSTASAQTTVNLTIQAAVPSGTVSAFNLVSCPSGWSDYAPAEGRFIAGIDPLDVTQNVGDISAGELPTIASTLNLFTATAAESTSPVGSPKLAPSAAGQASAQIYVNSETSSVDSVASGNAKPAHVILKYCEKD